MKRYPAYKASGVDWLGEVPEHWVVSQSRRMFAVRSEPAWPDDKVLTASQKYGVVYQSDFVAMEGRRVVEVILGIESLKHVEPNDFIISMRSFQGGIEWCRLRGSTSFHYVMLRPVKNVWPPFFAHLLKSTAYIQALRRTTDLIRDGQELRFSNFAQVDLPVVPFDEQKAIATFLNRETAKIDALIAEQEKLIALLAEKRQATISQAVTRGLDPGVPMKESGVTSLGRVPAHWGVCDLRRVVDRIEQGWSPECLGRPAEDLEWGVLKAGCVNRGAFNPSENKALPEELDPIRALVVRDGDLLMSRASGSPKLVGSTAVVRNAPGRLLLSDKVFRLHLVDRVEPGYVAMLFAAPAMRQQIEQAISGAEGLANNLPQASLKTFKIVAPPAEEQQAITKHINAKVAKLEAMSDLTEQSIKLLRERRAALITAAVTGQIDVRDAVAA
jgi:type I restriction enzyme, S subunit